MTDIEKFILLDRAGCNGMQEFTKEVFYNLPVIFKVIVRLSDYRLIPDYRRLSTFWVGSDKKEFIDLVKEILNKQLPQWNNTYTSKYTGDIDNIDYQAFGFENQENQIKIVFFYPIINEN